MVLAGQKGLLALLVGVWAYYHVIRQHYGFMVLYKVKNRDLLPLDNRLDRLFLGVMMIFPPFHRFFIHHPEELGITLAFPQWEPCSGWWWPRPPRRGWRAADAAAGAAIDLPKYLLFAAIIPLHWLTFAYMSWQAAVPTVTIVHNLQYHALVWFHNRNRYAATRPTLVRGEPEPAGAMSRRRCCSARSTASPASNWDRSPTWRSASFAASG